MKIQNLDRFKKKLARLPKVAREEMRKALAESAEEIVGIAKGFAPVISGDLRDSIGYTFGAYTPANANVRGVKASGTAHDLSVTIHAGDERAWYAALVEFGTAPHTIRPKRPGGLLNVNGRRVDVVHHPGATAQPFFYPAFRLGKKKARSRITRATNRAARKVAAGG